MKSAIVFRRISPDPAVLLHDEGSVPFYPASVVKLVFLAFAAHRRAEGMPWSDELERAARDMIVDSSNDATALIVDALTDTTGGPELPPDELAAWMDRRQAVNRWYQDLGFTGSACQKTWNEAPYGRERQGYGPNFERRNSLSAGESLQLLVRILDDPWMAGFLARRPEDLADLQVQGYIGSILPPGTPLWSKAGWTSEVRHDVAVFVLAEVRYGLAIFTDQGQDPDVISRIARSVLADLI